MFWETIQVQHVAKIHVIVVPLDRPPDIVVVRAHLVTDYLVQGRATLRTNEMTSHTSIVQLNFLQSGVKWRVSLSNQNIEGVVPSLAYVVGVILVV